MSSETTYQQASASPPLFVKEQDIETALIEKLRGLKYTERSDIHDRATLEANFRQKFEALNRVRLTDAEFKRLLEELTIPDVFTAARVLREKNDFTRDDGTPLAYTLVNIKDWCKNDFEVVQQLRINTDYSHHRYDVLLLINGVPVVQIELKTLSVNPRRAMEQIVDYKNDPGNGYTRTLLCFIQLFIVSNRTDTVYFANNNARHFAFNADERFLPVYRFADRDNKPVSHLDDFADRFLQKCELGRMISRYMVLIQSEQKLLMMRPYQIYAVQAIVDCIEQNCGNGYIWHTTGSGKTLTSFKASTLLKENEQIDKCLFVVDRKDLDRQTREEFNRFQEGCVEENTNTAALVRRLLSDDKADKVIVTTIQKLGLALSGSADVPVGSRANRGAYPSYRERLAPLATKRIVFIFDECHRSQFGDNHQAIKAFFPRAQLFGFTGTPIFDENASQKQIAGDEASMRTTIDLFQRELHAYTITHAIEDKNVLRFHVDYFRPEGKELPAAGQTLAKRAVVEAVLDKHDAATHSRRFNAIFATASINDAIDYYDLFQSIQAERQAADTAFVSLKIACVFSPPAEGNSDVKQLQEDLTQESSEYTIQAGEDAEKKKKEIERKKEALKAIIADYNSRYGSNHSIGEFDLYYQDVQKRIKDQQFPNADLPRKGAEKIDITLVVDMLLTGFDSKYLNTLYVDKNLKAHKKGLMQQLFPREGETLPRLRFPEFQDAPEWEEKKLEALAKRGSGHTPSKAHPEYYNGGIKWVSLADSRRLDKGLISETENEISEEGVENSSAVLHPAGAVLVSRDAGVGKSAVMGSAMAVSQHFIVWKCDSKKLSNWFLYYVLQTLKPLFERAATGSTIKTIGLQFFVDLVLIVPSLTEQRRIASCLSSLDDLITAQSDKLQALKTHKKGLMQQLFPEPVEAEA